MVLLARTDRPDPFKWHCPRCTRPVAELTGYSVTALTDTIDHQTRHLIQIRCDGSYRTNNPDKPLQNCRQWYAFEVQIGE